MDHTPKKKVQFKLPPSIKEERKKVLKPWCEGLCGTCEKIQEEKITLGPFNGMKLFERDRAE